MLRILGRAAALALITGLCATIPTAGASSRVHTVPALTLPTHPDGLSRALASGRISPAKEALLRAQALFHPATVAAAYGPVAPSGGDATMILRDLAVRLDGLAPSDRKTAHAILARPSDSVDPLGNAWTVPEAGASPDCGPDICIHWASGTGGDAPDATDTTPANGIPDYVDQALAVAENVWSTEVGTMAYRAPLSDATSTNHGPDGKLDIYLTNLGPQGLYGYCTSDDPGLNTPGTFTGSAYCVVDNNYTEGIFQNHTPIQNLKVTLAHEFFHAVQFAYDIGEDTWLMEGTATWMEDQVYDGINDNRQYLQNSQLKYPWIPLDHSARCCFQYGSWIWFRFLSETMGPGVIQEIWDRADAAPGGPDDYSTQAISHVLAAHGTTFRKKFASFAVWNTDPAAALLRGQGRPLPDAGQFGQLRARPQEHQHRLAGGEAEAHEQHLRDLQAGPKRRPPRPPDGAVRRSSLRLRPRGPADGVFQVRRRRRQGLHAEPKRCRLAPGRVRPRSRRQGGADRGQRQHPLHLLEEIAVLVHGLAARRRPRLSVPRAHQLVHPSLQDQSIVFMD